MTYYIRLLLVAIAVFCMAFGNLPPAVAATVAQVNVQPFGTVENGTSDDATAIGKALTSIGGAQADLLFPQGTYKINSNVAFPVNIRYCPVKGAKIYVTSGHTLTLAGGVLAGPDQQVFSFDDTGTSPVVLTGAQPMIYPGWFGALPDGSTNDTTAFAATMKAITALGGSVGVPAGTYMIDANTSTGGIRPPSNSAIYMAPGVTLKAMPNNTDGSAVVYFGNVSHVTIAGGHILGERLTHTFASTNITIAGTYLAGDTVTATVAGTPVVYTVVGGSTTVTLIAAGLANAININGTTGPLVTCTSAAGVINVSNDTPAVKNSVTVSKSSTSGTISVKTGTDEHGFGIRSYGSTDVLVDHITIDHCNGDSVYVGSGAGGITDLSNGFRMRACIIDTARRNGMSITGATNCFFNQCTFENTGTDGASNGTSPKAGVDVEPTGSAECSNITFSDCDFLNNGSQGIQSLISTTTRILVTGCRALNNLGSGIVLGGGPYQKAIACTSSGNAYRGIQLASTTGSIEACSIIANGWDGVRVAGGQTDGNIRISNNNITGNGVSATANGYGIFCTDLVGLVATGNSIVGNKFSGILVERLGSNRITVAGTYATDDTVSAVVNGVTTTYTVLSTDTTNDSIAQGLATAINNDAVTGLIVDASATTNVVSIVSDTPGTNYTITASRVSTSGTVAVATANYSADITITSNLAKENGQHGIEVVSVVNPVILGNKVLGNLTQSGYHGVYVSSCTGGIVSDNTIEQMGSRGIYAGSCADVLFSNNFAIGNSYHSDNLVANFEFNACTNCSVCNNVARLGANANRPKYGIWIAGGSDNIYRNNDVTGSAVTPGNEFVDTGTRTLGAGKSAAPSTGTWSLGDITWNNAGTTPGQVAFWILQSAPHTFGSVYTNPSTTLGDMVSFDGTNETRIAGNTTSTPKVFVSTGTGSAATAPAWVTLASTLLGSDINTALGYTAANAAALIATNLTSGTVPLARLSGITNTEISASAGIVDTKLATLSTVGKVANSATTAVATNTASTIMLRDGSGNSTMNMLSLAGTTTSATDAATKSYVDTVAQGLLVKAAVELATAAALPANLYSTGTLTGVSVGALTIDGTTPTVGQRVLVKNEVAGSNNGIYVVTTVGSGIAVYVLTRASDSNTSAGIQAGTFTFVNAGSTNSKQGFVQTADPATLDSTALVYTQFSGVGDITAGTGLSKTGNTLNVTTIPIANGGTGQTTQAAGFDALSPNTTLGDIGFRSVSNNIRLAGNTTSAKQVLTQTGTGSASAAPIWGALVAADINLWLGAAGLADSALSANVALLSAAQTFAGRITFGSGENHKTRVTSSTPVTVAPTDNAVIMTISGVAAISLPGSPATGDMYTLKDGQGDAGTNAKTITPAAGNIDGAATFVMNSNYQSVTLIYNGTQWNVLDLPEDAPGFKADFRKQLGIDHMLASVPLRPISVSDRKVA